jgi:hypothetical protein
MEIMKMNKELKIGLNNSKRNNMKKESKGKEINNRINLLLWIIGISFGVIVWLSAIIAFNI